ncbi:MAG: manganese efflux pump [Oscillospiraceae bacterium]|nr:manganese efflux pump [Oscillospiraceae bacterium]
MSYLDLFLLAVGLSMDAFAVSITNGLCVKDLKRSQMLWMGVCFGGFQALMPTIGYFLGRTFASYIAALDHYIALVLLGFIGGKMIFDALQGSEEEASGFTLGVRMLLMQGVATSIDALAVGVSFAALPDMHIGVCAAVIGVTTFCFSVVGAAFGKRFGQKLGNRAQLVGGLILIGIGVKIFVEHMFFTGA